jgi:hypothetical protein
MITFVETSLNNAIAMAITGFTATQARPPTAAVQTALDFLFDPRVNANAGVDSGAGMLLFIVQSILQRVSMTDTPFCSGLFSCNPFYH